MKTMLQVLVCIFGLTLLTVLSNQNSNCITWNYHDHALIVTCKVFGAYSNITFLKLDEEYAHCMVSMDSISTCWSSEGSNIEQNTTTNETILIINDVINTQVDGKWSCVYQNNTISTEVSLLSGLSNTVNVSLRGDFVETIDSYYIELQCASCWKPLQHAAEFLTDGVSVDSVKYHNGNCYNKKGECAVSVCSCSEYSGSYIRRTRIAKSAFKVVMFSCVMSFQDIFEYSIIKKYAFLEFTGTGFRYSEPTTISMTQLVESTTSVYNKTEEGIVETNVIDIHSISVISGIAVISISSCICLCVCFYTRGCNKFYMSKPILRLRSRWRERQIRRKEESGFPPQIHVPIIDRGRSMMMNKEYAMETVKKEFSNIQVQNTEMEYPILNKGERLYHCKSESDDDDDDDEVASEKGFEISLRYQRKKRDYKIKQPISDKEKRITTVNMHDVLEIRKDRENWLRHSVVIVDEVKKLLIYLLEYYLRKQGPFGVTLPHFIFNNKHTILHLYENRNLCCLCKVSPLKHIDQYMVLRKPQMDILLVLPTEIPLSGCTKYCCYDVNPHLQSKHLDVTLLRVLLINCTDIAKKDTTERKALDYLRDKLNRDFAHTTDGRMSDDEFEKSMTEIEMKMMDLASVCRKDADIKQSLDNIRQKQLL